MGRARANSDIASVERVGSGLTELSKSPGPYEVLITPSGSPGTSILLVRAGLEASGCAEANFLEFHGTRK